MERTASVWLGFWEWLITGDDRDELIATVLPLMDLKTIVSRLEPQPQNLGIKGAMELQITKASGRKGFVY